MLCSDKFITMIVNGRQGRWAGEARVISIQGARYFSQAFMLNLFRERKSAIQ